MTEAAAITREATNIEKAVPACLRTRLGHDMDALLPGFGAPCGKQGEGAAATVARENARAVVRRLIQTLPLPREISELLDRWTARKNSTIGACWHEVFSRIAFALRNQDRDLAAAVTIRLAIHLGECGEPGHWNATAAFPIQCSWGQWLLPAFDRITVESDGYEAVLKLGLQEKISRIVFAKAGLAWALVKGAAAPLAMVGSRSPKVMLLPRISHEENRPGAFPEPVDRITAEIADRWRGAFQFLRLYAPSYLRWVQRVVRQIGVLHAVPGTVHSGSYETRYGFIHASALASIPSSAEMAVHEASHQYYLLISRLGPVEDGTDGTLYYSPLVEKKRPLNRILFAFHACANILAFYRLCQTASSLHQEYFARNENVVLSQMKQLGKPLFGNPALTSLGRALLDPWQGAIS